MFRRLLGGAGILLAVLLMTGIAFGAQPAVDQSAGPGDVSGIPVEKWEGKIFTVLAMEQSEKVKGYPFAMVSPVPDLLVGQCGNIRADWLEGKKLEVMSVKFVNSDLKGPMNDYQVVFKEVSSGIMLTATALGGQVPHVVLADDLVNAQKYFIGKTIFSKRPAIFAYQTTPKAILVKVDEPLKVEEVVPGVTAAEPIWLVVTTPNNEKGYITIYYSNTNAYEGQWAQGKPWSEVIAEINPQETVAGNADVWAAIEAGKIKMGMSPDQVRLVLGEPHIIRTGLEPREQMWFYPSEILKFNANGLYSVENR